MDGRNQYCTWRSTPKGTPRSASSSGAHAPGQMTNWPAVYVAAAVLTSTPSRPVATQLVTGSSKCSSAPDLAARARWATTDSSGITSPAPCSYSAISSGAGAMVGKRPRICAASSSSCGRPHSCALRRLPATVRLSARPIITPPVRCTIVRPEAASTSGHSSAARSNSGT